PAPIYVILQVIESIGSTGPPTDQLRPQTNNPIMARHSEGSLTHIELVPAAPDQQPILANMLELYAHDFSEFHELELGVDGRFGYPYLPLYWSDPNRRPFLVRVGGKLAGLVLVKRGSELSGDETVWDMAEFFVVRRYRRRGIGTMWHTKSGGRFRAYGKFASWSRIIQRISSGRMPSRGSRGKRSSQVVSKTVANYGAYSHLNQSLSHKVAWWDKSALS